MLDDNQDQGPEWDVGWTEPPAAPGAALDDLRGQALEADLGGRASGPRAGLAGVLRGLAPWQRFALALLLFLDVALLGCMCLVMTGRVVPFR